MRAKYGFLTLLLILTLSTLIACTRLPAPQSTATSDADGNMNHDESTGEAASDSGDANPPITLDSGEGQEIGYVYEAYLSPHQEPGEEKDTPASIPEEFQSTEPSLLRSERTSRGHGVLRFTRDLSKVYVDVQVENVNPEDVVMFHIHCGRPDMLGPILVDFAVGGDIQANLEDGVFSVELTNEDILKTSETAHGLVGAYTIGCPIGPGSLDEVKTIAGMEYIAQLGELYFNLHTKAQTYFGDIRGQIHEAEDGAEAP